ncbi:MAG: FAD-dependent oxidoreductase [Planctomycetaceae bacterium]
MSEPAPGRHTGEFYNPVPPYQIPYGVIVPMEMQNLLVPTAVSSSHVGFCAIRLEPVWTSLGQAAGHAASLAVKNHRAVQNVDVDLLQRRLHDVGAATIYISDVRPGHPDFQAVQWWGIRGGLHGLAKSPEKPGQRGATLHGQYCMATPDHAAELHRPLDASTRQRWKVIARQSGILDEHLPKYEQLTRGEFIRAVYSAANTADNRRSGQQVGPNTTRPAFIVPRLNPRALDNSHAPGEVDNELLASKVVMNIATLSGIVVDDSEAVLEGDWQYSTHTPPFVGRSYLHDMNAGKGEKSITYTPTIPEAGVYEVRVSHCCNIRRSTNTLITIRHADGDTSVRINQQETPEYGGLFKSLGTFRFESGRSGWVRVSTEGTDGKYVIADAVQWLPVSQENSK